MLEKAKNIYKAILGFGALLLILPPLLWSPHIGSIFTSALKQLETGNQSETIYAVPEVKGTLFRNAVRDSDPAATTSRTSEGTPRTENWCLENTTKLVGRIPVDADAKSWEILTIKHSNVKKGGVVQPESCRAKHQVAIIIPYRDRDEHLRIFLNQIFPILQRQQIRCRVVIVEQILPGKFNRGMLLNIGFTEVLKLDPEVRCFIFHDVDLIPENDKLPFWCSDQPRHMSVAVSKFKYKLPYAGIFGGATAFQRSAFEKANGYPNVYFGWGGEDDDMCSRVRAAGYKIKREPNEIARYTMVKHGRDPGNEINPKRMKLLNQSRKRYHTDGLKSLSGTYSVVKTTEEKLLTRILVDINQDAVMKVMRS